MSDTTQSEVVRPAIVALKWNYLGVAARTASGFIVGIVLARLLGPKPFGEVAVAWLVIGLGNLMADCGFGAALVQRKELIREDIQFVFTAQVGLGLLFTAIVATAAPLVASAFRQPAVTPVVRTLSIVFTLQAIGLTSQNLLKRELAFRKLQTAQVASYLAGYLALGIPLAYLGFGVWSLVFAQLAQTLLNSTLLYLMTRHPIHPRIVHSHRGLTSYGSKVIGVNLSNWVINNSDTAIVGRVFGAVDLGLYNRSMTLMTTPMNSIASALQNVLFPVYSRAQQKPDLLRRGFLSSVAAIELCILPIFVTISVVPQTVIEGLYGLRWIAAVPLLVPLALAMPFHSLTAMSGPLLWGTDKVGRELRIQFGLIAVMLPALLVTSRVSLVAVAWAVLCIYALRAILMSRAALQVVSAHWSQLLRAILGAVLVTAIDAPLVWVLDRALHAPLGAVARLGVDVAVAGLIATVTLSVSWKLAIPSDLATLLRQSMGSLTRRSRGAAPARIVAPFAEETKTSVTEQA